MATPFVKHHFVDFPSLSSQELVLRQIVPSDAHSIREISFYDGVGAPTEEEAIAILERIEQDYEQGNSVHWGICLRGSNEVVGTCGFYRGYPANVGEVGYVLREAYRKRGVMTSALKLVLHFGLYEMKLAGIVAYTDPTNTASIGVLRRLNFRELHFSSERLKFSL